MKPSVFDLPMHRLAFSAAVLMGATGCANLSGFDSDTGPSPTERRFMAIESKIAVVDRHERVLNNLDLVSLQQKLQQQEEELRKLRGLVEQLQYDAEQSKQRQRQLYLDLDRRLSGSDGGPATTAPPVAGGGNLAVPAAQEEQDYLKAFDTLKAGQFDPAIQQFQAFIKQYPNSSYADNAQYWIGEAHYVNRRFQDSQAEFEKVMNNYPESQKAPDALLKQGFIQNELGNPAAAKAIFTRVVEDYPASTAAKLAAKRLSARPNP